MKTHVNTQSDPCGDAGLEGRRCLVTGGGTGIGRALTAALVTAGASVIICGRRQAPLDATEAALDKVGDIRALQCDVTDDDDARRLVEGAGAVDILVNNAGYAIGEPWSDVTTDRWREVMAINVEAPFRLCQRLVPGMVERRWGRVINIASLYATLAPEPGRYPGMDIDIASYVASKHALLGLTKHLAVMVGRSGVTVNAVSPGMFPDTQDPPVAMEVVEALAAGCPVGRVGVENDLCSALLFLASPQSGFVTGQNIAVDGGWSVW